MNCCVDWLTFTLKLPVDYKVKEYRPILTYALDICNKINNVGINVENGWIEGSGRYFFNKKFAYEGIEVIWDGAEDKGMHDLVCVNISGQGCRTWEYLHGDIISLISWANSEAYNVSRLDIAIDDREGLLDIEKIYHLSAPRYRNKELSELCYWWGASKVNSRQQGSDGCTMYYGSPQSEIRIRIYDKAAEQRIEDHWVRVETVLRNEKAVIALEKLCKTGQAGKIASEILRNQLFFLMSLVRSLTSRTLQGMHKYIYATGGINFWSFPNRLS